MKTKPPKSEASGSKSHARKKTEKSATSSLSKKLRQKKDGETSKPGAALKSAGVQRRGGPASILHYIYKCTLGQSLHAQMRQCLQEPFVRSLSSYHFRGAASPFDRRITCLEWHPTHPSTLAAASKGGDIYLWDFKEPTKKAFVQGMGPGDSVTDMKFDRLNPTRLFISSMRGVAALRDFNGTNLKVFANTDTLNGAGDSIGGMKFCPKDLSRIYVASGQGTLRAQSFEGHAPVELCRTQDCGHNHHDVWANMVLWCSHQEFYFTLQFLEPAISGLNAVEEREITYVVFIFWYCCVDVSVSRQMLVTGDNMGQLLLVDLDGKKIFSDRLHKAKVSHAEFNPRCDWLLATASVDHTVKLWDLRNMKDKRSFLHEMHHEKAVNSAYFNPTDCSKLLTTDQYDQIRVYCSPEWSTPQHIIQHPHRQFQHLTPIKATWHPVYDLIVAGRYPDDCVCGGDQRTIDIYDSDTAELVCQLYDPAVSGIKCVNKFSPMGDVLGTGMGITVLVWDRSDSLMSDGHEEQESPSASTSASAGSLRGQRRSQQRPGRERRGPAMDANLRKKLASLEETETETKSEAASLKQKQARARKK